MRDRQADVLVIGAGIAGASVAAHLALRCAVVVLERESQPGYHSTGRSAALFSETYGNPVIRALTRASRAFLLDTPQSFTSGPLSRPRGSLFIATTAQIPALEVFAGLPDVAPITHRIDVHRARALCPILREETLAAALLEPGSADLDVQALHQGYLRGLRGRNGRVVCDAPIAALEYTQGAWHVYAGVEEWVAPIVVNAAGAWADEIAQLAGLPRIGLVPCRRTALLLAAPPRCAIESWPMVIDIDELFYFKPEAGSLLLSPGDETPSEPTDAQPDDWDVAVAIDRMQTATTLEIERPQAKWAGLRSFTPDRAPVAGYSTAAAGFFWLAGQGGYGIQTAPALSRAAAALVLNEPLPEDLLSAGVQADELSPARLQAIAPVG